MTRSQQLELLKGLVRVNDADLVERDSTLNSQVCSESDRPLLRAVTHILNDFYQLMTQPVVSNSVVERSLAKRRASTMLAVWDALPQIPRLPDQDRANLTDRDLEVIKAMEMIFKKF